MANKTPKQEGIPLDYFLIQQDIRPGILAYLRFDVLWSEIDLNVRVWTIPSDAMPTGIKHSVPLTDEAIALLKEMPRIAGTDKIFPNIKFPNMEGSTPLDIKLRGALEAAVQSVARPKDETLYNRNLDMIFGQGMQAGIDPALRKSLYSAISYQAAQGMRSMNSHKLRDDCQDKKDCQEIAKNLWREKPELTITDMIKMPAIKSYARKYKGKNTLRTWLSEIDQRPPEKKRGRPRK